MPFYAIRKKGTQELFADVIANKNWPYVPHFYFTNVESESRIRRVPKLYACREYASSDLEAVQDHESLPCEIVEVIPSL